MDAELGHGGAEGREAATSLIEVAERSREVAGSERHETAVVHRKRGVVLLAGRGEEPFGRAKVTVGRIGGAAREPEQPAQGESACCPDGVMRLPQRDDGGPQLIEGLAVAAEQPQRASQPEADSRGGQAVGARHCCLQCVQAGHRPATVDERDSQCGEGIALAVTGTGLPGQPYRTPQVADGC